MKTILVVGSGGREHALAWRIAQSPQVGRVIVAPGNGGTATEPRCENVAVDAEDIDGLLELARRERVDLTVIGPEAPLVAGIVDRFEAAGLRCFGPRQAAAQLEGSKAFAKAFMDRIGVPTAAFATFDEVEPALAWLRQHGAPIVVKADGLAAGKGVIVAQTLAEAEAAVRDMLADNVFGPAGSRVVLEEFLAGEEASYIVVSDGKNVVPLASSQDHKARDDGDRGPNTGGMGAYSPAPVVSPEIEKRIMAEVIEPVIRAMAEDGHPFVGFLYAGVMIDAQGTPKVLEFNVRCGDPETQPIMMRLDDDLVKLLERAIDGRLEGYQLGWLDESCLGVVMAADGYPGSYAKGMRINGLDRVKDAKVFHAGTRADDDATFTAGGRVLAVCALDADLREAQRKAYAAVDAIEFDGAFCRRDIGYRAIDRG